MTIDPKKVYTMSAQEYVGPNKRILDIYDAIALHVSDSAEIGKPSKIEKLVNHLVKEAPKGTEAIVGYIESQGIPFYTINKKRRYVRSAHGTALIPKDKKLEDRE